MNEQMEFLVELQRLDREINKEDALKIEIEEGIKEREENLKKKEQELEQEKNVLEERQKELRHQERALADLDYRLKKSNDKIYTVKTQKEMTSLDHEREDLKNKKSSTEEAMLDLMQEIEGNVSRLKNKEMSMEEERKESSQQIENSKKVLEECRQRLEKLNLEKKRHCLKIDQYLLREYARLLKSKDNYAVAQVKDGICQGCFVTISATLVNEIKKDEEILRCENCARFLY